MVLLNEARRVFRLAADEGSLNSTPCWSRHIQARLDQPWARCSVLTPATEFIHFNFKYKLRLRGMTE